MAGVDAELLKIMCCPETHQKLRLANSALIEQLNQQITAGTLKNRGGEVIKEKLSEGLIREDGKFLYPVRQYPVMLVSEGIAL